MGNLKKPVELLVLQGKKHLTKQEIADRKKAEVKAPADNIECPDYMTIELKKQFDFYISELTKIDIIANIDTNALERFVIAESQYRKASQKLIKMSVVNKEYDNMLNIQTKLFKQCREGANDLGLTISSRCKLVVPKKEEKPISKFDKFAGGKSG